MSDDTLMDRRGATHAQVMRLGNALRTYARHLDGCLYAMAGKCTCGLSACIMESAALCGMLAEQEDGSCRGSGIPPPDGLY